MATDLIDDEPAFAVTVYSIMDRYRTGVIEHRTACRALSAIALALAPDNLFDVEGEHRLGGFFAAKLDAYRDDRYAEVIRTDVVRVIIAAAEADWDVLKRHGVGR